MFLRIKKKKKERKAKQVCPAVRGGKEGIDSWGLELVESGADGGSRWKEEVAGGHIRRIFVGSRKT